MKTVTRVLIALVGLGVLAGLAGVIAVAGVYFYLSPDLPSAETLRDVKLQVPLKVYSRDGRLMAQIGEMRRTPKRYDEIPPVVVNAFLAAEDDRFFEHPGFDYQGIIRAAINLVRTGERTQGGSTITQQLARVYFLSRERTFVRKAKELLLALQIEREFTKEEILALYLNKIFLGQRAYGVAAAAEVYFGKDLGALSVAEAATIAGIPKAPSTLNPVSNPERARERRAYVLRRMLELDYIDQEGFDAAIATPVESRLYGPKVALEAPYVTEMVRGEMVARFGPEAYTDGYRVVTTVDARLQGFADRALRTALLEYDRRHGYRGPAMRKTLEQLDAELPIDAALAQLVASLPRYPDLHTAVVLELGDDNSAGVYVRDTGRVRLPFDSLNWRPYVSDSSVGPAPASVADVVAPGDVIYLLKTADQGWRLAQLPAVQGAFIALDPSDGAIIAISGGYDFYASKFNRAVQSRRQPGSSFKPFIYSAALENGFTPATVVNDAPVVFDQPGDEEVWRPENNSRTFYGPTRMREGLVRSLNLVSVRILLGAGISKTVAHVKSFGLPATALPANPTLALGSGGASPRDMAAGYAVFANGGHRVEPYIIDRVVDATGQVVLESLPPLVCAACEAAAAPESAALAEAAGLPAASTDLRVLPNGPASPDLDEVPAYADARAMIAHATSWRPEPLETPAFFSEQPLADRAISAQNAYLMYDMMRDVIRRGTGRRALALGRQDLAGKTGTSNDRRDAWFSGFNSELVATAWVGFDQERSLGAREEGSRTALPMWIYFMEKALAHVPESPLDRPPGIVTARIMPETGQLAPAGASGAIFEIFMAGNVPEPARGGGAPDPLAVARPNESAVDESIF